MHMAPQEPRDEDLMIQMISATQPVVTEDPLDDVFGSDSESPAFGHGDQAGGARESHPSDIPRLQAEHATAGYRDGVVVAKGKSIQAGFDEGYGLGATIGLAAGQLLGFLEGLGSAIRTSNPDEHRRINELFALASGELSTERIFDQQYWAPNGTWKYEIGTEGQEDIIFEDVAKAHPLISKWTSLVEVEITRWGVDRAVLSSPSEAQGSGAPEKKELKIDQKPREVLDW
ncbi:hypothetical protein BX600DRAFT_437601 [Xylariales sp. PMI_506]|nr:hypothetical protein BX600DRAFT_437601 [Xylariales sp. PMI_506]